MVRSCPVSDEICRQSGSGYSDVSFLGHPECAVDCNNEIPDSAFELGVQEKPLRRSRVLGPAVD